MLRALITGVAGEVLSSDERRFFGSARPCGLILFARNCSSHDQIRTLVDSTKQAVGSDKLLVLIDQEGGRVQRLRPPLGRALPPAETYARLYQEDPDRACRAARQVARLVAEDLLALGINTNCTPVLDVPVPGAHAVIGDRAFGTAPEQISSLGRAVAEGFLEGGVLPVIKHIPGHGRANADSHHDLPVVTTSRAELSQTDFLPFRNLRDMPLAMTAHVVFTDIDASAPASTSPIVTSEIMRGEIGFDGLLMSDDLSMKALKGTIRHNAEAVLRAGSDVALHCNGVFGEMEQAAEGSPILSGQALERFMRAQNLLTFSKPYDRKGAETVLSAVLEGHLVPSESV